MKRNALLSLIGTSLIAVMVAACSGNSNNENGGEQGTTSGAAGESNTSQQQSEDGDESASESGTSAGGDEALKDAVIQVLMPGVNPYASAVEKGAKAEGEKLGVRIESTQSQFDESVELSNVKNAITKGVDAIVILPVSSQSVVPAIQEANDAGICTVAVTAPVGPLPTSPDQYDVFPGMKGFVGWNEIAGGEIIGKALAEKMDGSGNIVMVQGTPTDGAGIARENGAELAWKSYPDVKLIGSQHANFDEAQARSVMLDFVQRFGDEINGVYSITNNMAVPIADVIEDSPLKGKVTIVAGAGGQQQLLDYIKAGKVYATVPEAPQSEGAKGVELAADCIKGNKDPVFVKETELPALAPLADDGYLITADNVDKFKAEW